MNRPCRACDTVAGNAVPKGNDSGAGRDWSDVYLSRISFSISRRTRIVLILITTSRPYVSREFFVRQDKRHGVAMIRAATSFEFFCDQPNARFPMPCTNVMEPARLRPARHRRLFVGAGELRRRNDAHRRVYGLLQHFGCDVHETVARIANSVTSSRMPISGYREQSSVK